MQKQDWETELQDLIETNWQKMEGPELVDVDPIKWFSNQLALARREESQKIMEILNTEVEEGHLEPNYAIHLMQKLNQLSPTSITDETK